MVFEAERLRLRKINQNNFDDLCDILRDETPAFILLYITFRGTIYIAYSVELLSIIV